MLIKSTPHMTKFYAIIRALWHWHHYLLSLEFVIYFDHETLHYLHSQKKLNFRHGSWVEFLQWYSFVAKHRARVENKAIDALSRRVSLLSVMSVKVTGFEWLNDDYMSCSDFGEIYTSLSNASWPILDDYTFQDGYVFIANKLCIPLSLVRDFLVWETHEGGLVGHFGQDKTTEEVECQFYWLGLKRGVTKIVRQCRIVNWPNITSKTLACIHLYLCQIAYGKIWVWTLR